MQKLKVFTYLGEMIPQCCGKKPIILDSLVYSPIAANF